MELEKEGPSADIGLVRHRLNVPAWDVTTAWAALVTPTNHYHQRYLARVEHGYQRGSLYRCHSATGVPLPL